MLERFDHRSMLTAALALSTTVLLVVVVAMLIIFLPSASPPSNSGGNPGAGAAPANMDAGGESYGWNERHAAERKANRVSDSKFSD